MDDLGPTLEDAERWARLTDKHRACLDPLLERKTSKIIARELDISKPTVDQRLTSARKILGASNRDETAIAYARLKRIYDRVIYDPMHIPNQPSLVPSDFSDGGEPDALALSEQVIAAGERLGSNPPFKDLWRHDQSTTARILILAVILAAVAIFLLSGLGIAQALTQLISH